MRSYQRVRLHKSLVLVRKKELLDFSFHLIPIQEFSLSPHRQRDSHSALRSRNALATPTCQCPLARVAKQRGKRVRRQVMCRPRGDFCQRPYRYLGLPFVQPALQWSASISTMCKRTQLTTHTFGTMSRCPRAHPSAPTWRRSV